MVYFQRSYVVIQNIAEVSILIKEKSYLSEYLKVRSHDPEEAIRHDVIVSIVTAARKDILLVNDHLLNFVRERTLDKRVSRNTY